MVNYIIRRLLIMPVTIFGVTVLIFGMLQFLTPEERSALYVRDIPHNDAAMHGIILRYGLDQPIPVQYWYWLVGKKDPETGQIVGGILRGDFGYSRSASQPVIDLVKRRFPATLELTLWSVVPIIGVGVWLGVISAVNHNKLDRPGGAHLRHRGHLLPDLCVRAAGADDLLRQPALVPTRPSVGLG